MELATPGSAVRHASVARHVTDCATRPGDCNVCGYAIITFQRSYRLPEKVQVQENKKIKKFEQ